MELFAHRLIELRKEFGLTQKKLAEIVSVHERALQKYESGTRLPETAVLMRMAKYFRVSLDYLLGITDEPRTPLTETEMGRAVSRDDNPLGIPLNEEELETLSTILNDPEAMVMFRDFASMGEKDRRRVLKIWKALLDDETE